MNDDDDDVDVGGLEVDLEDLDDDERAYYRSLMRAGVLFSSDPADYDDSDDESYLYDDGY